MYSKLSARKRETNLVVVCLLCSCCSVSGGTSRCLGTRTSGQQRPGRTWGVEASFSGETRGQWTRNYVRAAMFGLRGEASELVLQHCNIDARNDFYLFRE